MAVTRKLGAFKTSMLQDAEAGRSLEIDALVAAPREIGKMFGVATPNMDSLHGLIRLFAKGRGLLVLGGWGKGVGGGGGAGGGVGGGMGGVAGWGVGGGMVGGGQCRGGGGRKMMVGG